MTCDSTVSLSAASLHTHSVAVIGSEGSALVFLNSARGRAAGGIVPAPVAIGSAAAFRRPFDAGIPLKFSLASQESPRSVFTEKFLGLDSDGVKVGAVRCLDLLEDLVEERVLFWTQRVCVLAAEVGDALDQVGCNVLLEGRLVDGLGSEAEREEARSGSDQLRELHGCGYQK